MNMLIVMISVGITLFSSTKLSPSQNITISIVDSGVGASVCLSAGAGKKCEFKPKV